MGEAVTRDIASSSSDWLKLAALCLFRGQSVSKNKSTCVTVPGQARKVIDQHSYLIHSMKYTLCLWFALLVIILK